MQRSGNRTPRMVEVWQLKWRSLKTATTHPAGQVASSRRHPDSPLTGYGFARTLESLSRQHHRRANAIAPISPGFARRLLICELDQPLIEQLRARRCSPSLYWQSPSPRSSAELRTTASIQTMAYCRCWMRWHAIDETGSWDGAAILSARCGQRCWIQPAHDSQLVAAG